MKNELKKVSKNADTFENLKNGPPFRLDESEVTGAKCDRGGRF